jgi:hypothetical protein
VQIPDLTNWRQPKLARFILAAADSDSFAEQMIDWLEPVLFALPQAFWRACKIDTGYRAGMRAAQIGPHARNMDWQIFENIAPLDREQYFPLTQSNCVLAVLADESVAGKIVSTLDGIAAAIACIDIADHAAQRLRAVFAAFGVVVEE